MARFSSAVCGVLLVATVAFAGEAELDPSWGSYGVVTSDPSTGPDYAGAVVVQTDGKVLMVGGTERGHRTVPIVSR